MAVVRYVTLVLFLAALAGGTVAGQESSLSGTPEADKGDPGGESVPAVTGDVITFSSGKVLRGMQVLRVSSRTVVVQVLAGMEPLVLTRRFIDHIEYDDIEPGADGEPEEGEGEGAPNVIVADRLAGDLHKNLNAPLPRDLLASDGEDLVRRLERLARATGVRIEIGAGIRGMPKERRRWHYEAPPRTSLESLLREHLLARFDGLAVLYRFDHIVVTTAGEVTSGEADS